jgi:NADPH:quinone reductase-like Zn-dependent oxidoreductase
MSSIRIQAKAEMAAALAGAIHLAPQERPVPAPGQALVEIHASGVNPSDGKAMLGIMPHAVWPRTPGRDYAGVVIDGPLDLIGTEVWGTGGDLGITRDGAHARYLLLPVAAVRPKPARLSMVEAGSIGVPFVTAHEGFRQAGHVQPGDIVLVLGVNGKVGQAAAQLAVAAGARVFGVARGRVPFRGHARAPVTMLAAEDDWAAQFRAASGGHGADIVYNTMGSPYFTGGCQSMATGGRQIFISTLDRAVPFDIFAFYRGRHRFIGIDTLALTAVDCADIMDALRPGFQAGALRPFPVTPDNIHDLANAAAVYQAVLGGAEPRMVLTPSA